MHRDPRCVSPFSRVEEARSSFQSRKREFCKLGEVLDVRETLGSQAVEYFFQSQELLEPDEAQQGFEAVGHVSAPYPPRQVFSKACPKCGRSEEHTSELQSQSNLVCR